MWELENDTISTHAPHTGSDSVLAGILVLHPNFNPRSPHGERPVDDRDLTKAYLISTHAPHTGSDGKNEYNMNCG